MDNSIIIVIIIIIVILIGIFILINYKCPTLFKGGYTEEERLASFNTTFEILVDKIISPKFDSISDLNKDYFGTSNKRDGAYVLLTYIYDDRNASDELHKFKYYYNDDKLIYINDTDFMEYNITNMKLVRYNDNIYHITFMLDTGSVILMNPKSILISDDNFDDRTYNYHQCISMIEFGQNRIFESVCSPGHDITELDSEVHYGESGYIDHDTLIEFINKWYYDKGYRMSKLNILSTTINRKSKTRYYGVMVFKIYSDFCKKDKIDFMNKDIFIEKLKNKLGDKFDGNDLTKLYFETNPYRI